MFRLAYYYSALLGVVEAATARASATATSELAVDQAEVTPQSYGMELTNGNNVMYTAIVGIGSPPQYAKMIFDTGSSHFWVERKQTRGNIFCEIRNFVKLSADEHFFKNIFSKPAKITVIFTIWSILKKLQVNSELCTLRVCEDKNQFNFANSTSFLQSANLTRISNLILIQNFTNFLWKVSIYHPNSQVFPYFLKNFE